MSDPLEPYWTALGKFLHRYAQIEQTLNIILRLTAGVTHKRGRALFSGTRVAGAIELIKRIHDDDGRALSPWLVKALPKLKELTTARDLILHQGFALDSEQIVVSNSTRTVPRNAKTLRYSVSDLYDMEADTCVAHACLNMWWLEERYPKSLQKMRRREEKLAQIPWRHKPPQPNRVRSRAPKNNKGK